MDDDCIPYSQMANDAYEINAADPLPDGPTTFAGAFNAPPAGNGSAAEAAGIQIYRDPLAGKHGKILQDPIHGCYRLDAACTLIYDTREFQRLRRLKQLGMTYYVFPGASHNRFEHSLGVAHLAYRFANQMHQAQQYELDIDRGDIRVVTLAGLCHDLGHGPFSHVFDREFLRCSGITDWEHEDMSANMLDYIIDENHIDVLSADDVRRIKALITAGHGPAVQSPDGSEPTPPLGKRNRWLGEIVANGRNSIDVDKFDYLARDAKYCGVKLAFDMDRIMQFSRVIGDEICYKYTEYMTLAELFHSRATMHRSVYTHKKAKAIEFMVVDALLEAEPALKFTEKIRDPAEFKLLDDGILDLIENFNLLSPVVGSIDQGVHSCIESAQKIIARLRKRQLYKYVSDCLIPIEALERGQWKAPTADEIIAHYRGSDVKLNANDVIMHENKIDYSMANKNPLDNVHFYDDIGSTTKRKLKQDQISSMFVATFQEKRLRIYSRNADPAVVQAVHQAFENWLKARFGGQVEASTPAKPMRPPMDKRDAPVLGGQGVKRGRQLFAAGEGPPLPPSSQPDAKHMKK